jgi:hypothetical protein
MMMEHDFSDNAEESGSSPGPGTAAAAKSGRYDFEIPEHLTVSDMLSIQLADCVRIMQTLSDQASDPRLEDTERLHTIHSLERVVNASETLTRTIDRLRSGEGFEDERPSKHAKR